MADTYTITVPQITAIALSQNPTTISHALTVAATIAEITKTLYAEGRATGEFICGEA